MIKVENINNKEDIDLEKLDEEIQKQFKQLDKIKESISFGNKMLIAQPFIFIGIITLGYILGINQYEDFLSYIFLDNGMPLINTSILSCSAITFFSIAKYINKNKMIILKKEINKNLAIQKKYEFNDDTNDKTNSIYITDIEIKEEKLNNIQEINLPEISITNSNHKSNPKIRILKKDNK